MLTLVRLSSQFSEPRLSFLHQLALILGVGIALALSGCETAVPRPPLPPSESDLVLLKSTAVCGRRAEFHKNHPVGSLRQTTWGTGQELTVPSDRSPSHADESYFFDEDGFLVGALFSFSSGLDLSPYPVLRDTLTKLKPALEFYVNVANLSSPDSMNSSTLYETGDEKTTTQYLVLAAGEHPTLLQASIAIDPYARLFSPYRREFLERLRNPTGGKGGQKIESQGSEDKDPFPSLQQFARGETALLSYCGSGDDNVAADAFTRAIASGISDKDRLADAHNKLGLAFLHKGEFQKAKAEMQQSLAIRPNYPPVLNNLGEVQVKLGEKAAALSSFEKAVMLRPNYPIARYHLAEAYEPIDSKRAISEYETYLALVEGIPDEADRIALVQQRVKALKKP